MIHMALSCLAREERRPPSAEKVRDTTGNHSQIRNLLLFFSKEYFSILVSMDSGSLMMSEIVDILDDSSPSEDSCLMEVGLRSNRERTNRTASEGADGSDSGEYTCFRYPPTQTPESPLAGGPRARRFLRGERSNSCSSPSTATPTYR